jgi:RNA polymerase sigma-70 factor, ECF subfamily
MDAMLAAPPIADNAPTATDVRDVLRDHGEFLWKTLGRLGVRDADLPDMFQEVLLRVHLRIGTFEGRSELRTWLFGICRRVAAGYRRRAHRRRERLEDSVSETKAAGPDPEQESSTAQARDRLSRILQTLSSDKRAVFVMFEVEGLSSVEIAEELGIPVGTVHSRLHAARAAFKRAIERLEAAEKMREKKGRRT